MRCDQRPLLLATALLAAATAVAPPHLAGVPPAKTTAFPGAAAPSATPQPAVARLAVPARKRPLPDLELVTLDGERLRTRDLRGKVVLLDFWATWCVPCRAAVPHLKALHERLADKPFALVSISSDLEREAVERFVADQDMEWEQVWDGERQKAIRRLNVRSYPTYFLVDHEGNVVLAVAGWGPNVEREIDSHLAQALEAATAAVR